MKRISGFSGIRKGTEGSGYPSDPDHRCRRQGRAGYDVYEEGVKNHYFCQREDGSDFVSCCMAGGYSFSGCIEQRCQKWFGDKYRFLIEKGIDGFWNDMNEPAIFYSTEGMKEVKELVGEFAKDNGRKDPYLEDAECTSQCCKQSGRLSEILP